jgi:uncharacterized protein YunC (DUF1805 family)
MTKLPQSTVQTMQFGNGVALGSSQKWMGGQFCSILTVRGLVGCGIYDVKTAERFGQAVAIARGTPQRPLCEPEDLLEARIVELTPQAAALGVVAGMTGREAVERMLGAVPM